VSLDAVARVVSALSCFAASRPGLAEIELNPVVATPSGCVALDAHAVPGSGGQHAGVETQL
jgi:hypothetical protein